MSLVTSYITLHSGHRNAKIWSTIWTVIVWEGFCTFHRNMSSCKSLENSPCKDKLEWLGCLACRIEDYPEMEKHTSMLPAC